MLVGLLGIAGFLLNKVILRNKNSI